MGNLVADAMRLRYGVVDWGVGKGAVGVGPLEEHTVLRALSLRPIATPARPPQSGAPPRGGSVHGTYWIAKSL